GQKHYQGSLYVSLEADHPAPVIILKDHPQSGQRPQATIPYLVESRWLVRGVAHPSAAGVVFRVQGFGPGQMVWQSPWRGGFIALLRDDDGRLLEKHQGMIEADGLIRFTFSASALDGAAAELRFQPDVAEVAAPS
ncbi:MAG TPA: hypothetical protein HPQ00_00980, partial [Magnetococcales bacterium]|nr:hypothetical protein [Magnetococcales bacterium]